MANDFLGNTLSVGDEVAFAVSSGAIAQLRTAVITATTENSISVRYTAARPNTMMNRLSRRVGEAFTRNWTTSNLDNVVLLKKQ